MTAAVGSGHLSEVTGSVPLRIVDVEGGNVHGVFRTPTKGALSVLLTAHFDGVGDDPQGVRFPAACDNASGSRGSRSGTTTPHPAPATLLAAVDLITATVLHLTRAA